ncbi:class I SAM-dependent methyltransferase [Nocardia sp. 2]|uniref:Class I SAM-dependent methyltransferase n=1 Tax=Nocardia acididurans TaxID=2802282 RepID=A0ABS1M6S0_9NOCA|nr:class I SAM-dependent methyltransferase [Nocardia acididurans]MBL1075904.1 class I SAM-dependent methyltransferase [Nocardia acididurans]
MGEQVSLGQIQETLLIPLYGRALDARGARSVLGDRKAIDLVERIDYDFTKFRGPSLAGSVLRASIFDEYVREFLRRHPDGTVVDLGCGLSTRFDRLDNGRLRWFDLDMPDSMALRERFFENTDRYTMLTGSMFGTEWHERVKERSGPVFLLSEAVMLYFPADEVHAELERVADAFPDTPFAFDTGGALMMRTQDRNPVFRAVTARMQWPCDDPRTLESHGVRLVESRTFATPQPALGRTWPARYRLGLKLIGWTAPVRSYKVNLFRTRAA